MQPPVKPAWRTVHPRPKKKKKAEQAAAAAAAPPMASTSAIPAQMMPAAFGGDLRRQVTSWATWQRTSTFSFVVGFAHHFDFFLDSRSQCPDDASFC